jgi:hypothetical protein
MQLLERPKFWRIEKIKTIGSTYMAASGLSERDESPNQAVITMAKFAHEMQKKLDSINKHSFNDFKLKIGKRWREGDGGWVGGGGKRERERCDISVRGEP